MRGPLTAARLLTLVLFLLLVSICAYWLLQILAPRPAIAPSASIGDTTAAANLAPAAKLFGSASAIVAGPQEQPSNIQVNGVAEAGPNGVVILSIDGKPGAPFAVNETVTDGTLVKSVTLDKVVLEQRGRLIELKTPDRASRDVLSSGAGKPRKPSEAGTAPPVASRPVAAPPPPPPPQQQQSLQVQEQLRLQMQQQQAQQYPQQQAQPQGQQLPQAPEGMQQQMQGQPGTPQQGQPGTPQFRPPAPAGMPGGSQPVPGGQQPDGSTAVSGQQQLAPVR